MVHGVEKVKVTDLLISAHDGQSGFADKVELARTRFKTLALELDSQINIDEIFDNIIETYESNGRRRDYLISRGEFLSAQLMAEQLGYEFVDAADVILFDESGELLTDETRQNLQALIKSHDRIVLPGFYGSDKTGKIVTFSRGGSDKIGRAHV